MRRINSFDEFYVGMRFCHSDHYSYWDVVGISGKTLSLIYMDRSPVTWTPSNLDFVDNIIVYEIGKDSEPTKTANKYEKICRKVFKMNQRRKEQGYAF